MWLENLKNLFDKLKSLGKAIEQNKSDMGKTYEGLRDIADALVLLNDMRRKHNKKITHCLIIKLNTAGDSMKRLGIDLPKWLRTLCSDAIMYHVDAQWQAGNYRTAFCSANVDL